MQAQEGTSNVVVLCAQHPKFRIGTIVKFKAGGQRMTVTGSFQNGLVEVSWFIKGHLQRAVFPADSLAKGR